MYIFFIISHNDRDMVKTLFMIGESLTPYLEEDHEFSLILHERDFPGGVTIMSNIINAVDSTRRTIMVLSK